MSAVGETIQATRLLLGMTQRELADKLGVSRMVIRHVEAGRSRLTAAQLTRVHEILGLQPDGWLVAVAGYCMHCGGTGRQP